RRPELGKISGGLPFLVKDVLGVELGTLFLVAVVFAVFVCALAVQAASVRLLFSMARGHNFPFWPALSHVHTRTRAPIVPSVLVGALAAGILILNVDLPHVIETLCSVAIIWANLAYLLVTFPLLCARLRCPGARASWIARSDVEPRSERDADAAAESAARPFFSLGRWGLAINVIAVAWGLFVVINIGWPRSEIYGSGRWGRV